MQVNSFMGLLGAIVTVALVTTIVSNKNSATVLRAASDGFVGALMAAQGKQAK